MAHPQHEIMQSVNFINFISNLYFRTVVQHQTQAYIEVGIRFCMGACHVASQLQVPAIVNSY